ncbi:MAG: translocation/assembly module TamB domain-containing protein [Candidatus Saccharicenans sp.]|nr:translocation/assembly module TamB domain-containing protein [Candidatus Saccharicenans sp.]
MKKDDNTPKRKKRKFIRTAVRILLGLVLILIFSGLFLQTPWGGKLVLRKAGNILREKMGLSLQADSLKLNIFRLKAALSGLKISPAGKSLLPVEFISADRIIFQTGWSTITGGQLRIKDLEIINPIVKLKSGQPGPEDRQPTPAPPTPETGAAGISFRIDHFRLERGAFSFEKPATPLSMNLIGLEASVQFDEDSHFHLASLEGKSGSLLFGRGQAEITGLEVKAAFNPDTIRLDRISLAADNAALNIHGTVENYLENPELNLKTDGRLALSELAAMIWPGQKLGGQLSWELGLTGTAARPEITGGLKIPDLEIYDLKPVDLSLDISPSREAAHLVKADVSYKWGRMHLAGTLPPGLKGNLEASLSLQRLDLRALQALLPDFPVELASEISGRLEFEARELSADAISGLAELKLEPTVRSGEAESRPAVPVSGDLSLSYSDETLKVNKLNLALLNSRLEVRGKLESLEIISGQLTWRLDDLKAVIQAIKSSGLPKMAVGLEQQLSTLDRLSGSVLLEARFSGQLNRPQFSLALDGQNLGYGQVGLPYLEIKADGNPEKINLRQLLVTLDHGRITAAGVFQELKASQGTVFRLDGRLDISDLDLSQFSGLLAEENRQYLNGLLSGKVNLAGTTARPGADFQLQVAGTEAGTLKLESLEISGEYSPDELSFNKIDLRLGQESQLQGRISFRPRSGDVRVELEGRKLKATLFQSWLPALTSGLLDLKLSAVGPWKNAVADLTITGQGFMIDRIWFPYFELKADSDGHLARARLNVPRFNLSLETGMELKEPHLLSGLIQVRDLPLSALAGLLPEVEETSPLVALSAVTRFSLPLSSPEKLEAEFKFENFDFAGLAVLMPSLESLKPGGRADGRLELKGFSSDLKGTELDLEIPSLNLRLGGNEIRNEGPLAIQLREGKLRVGSFILNSGRSRFSLGGGAELKDPKNPALDFTLKGDLDLSDFGSWLSGMQVGGKLQLQTVVRGDLEEPLIEGSGTMEEVFLRMQDLPLILSSASARFRVDNSQLVLDSLTGLANSGSFSGSGRAVFGQNFSLTSARIDFNLRDFDFNYPPGLSSLSEASLVLSKDRRGWALAGDLSILNASYRQDFYPSTQGLKMALSKVSPVGTEYPAFLYDLPLDINIRTIENIIIKNNLADLELKANLNLKGTIPAPILSGRAENAYSGELIIGERKYAVERLRVDFLGRENLEPNLDIFLKSTVYDLEEEVEVSLVMSGTPSDLKFSLTSVPSRSQEDLASLLLTGKSLRQVQGSALNTISGQLVQHFSSPLTSPVTRTLKKWLKAEDVILEPLNIATLQDPGARLTVRKRMTRDFAVTYSIDLTNSQYQTWILDYRLKRNFSTRAFRRDDGVVGLNLRHRLNFGQTAKSGGQAKIITKQLSRIEISGETIFSEEQLTGVVKLKPGRRYRTSAIRQARNRLEAFYRKQGYLNARIEDEVIEQDENNLDLKFHIQAGQPAGFKFTGDKLPARVRKKAINSWVGRLPEEANLYQLKAVLLNELNRRGYYKAEVNLVRKPEKGQVLYEVSTRLNGRWKVGSFKLSGDPVFREPVIRKIVSDYFGARARGLWNLVYDRKIALELIEYFYQENGYLSPKIEAPVIEENDRKRLLDLTLKIEAGPRSQVDSLEITGNSSFQTTELTRILNLQPGSVFSWPALNEDRTVLQNRYRSAGYKDVRVEIEARPAGEKADYEVKINIEEGPVYTISGIDVEGARRTRKSFVLKESGLKPGEPVSLEKLAQAQKNLYDATSFQAVNVSSEAESSPGHQEKVRVRVLEMPWLSLTYGLQYNTDTRFEGFTQFDFNNLFGRGWHSLLYFRANQRQQDARASLKIPYLFGRKLDSLLSVFYLKDIRDLYITEEIGASFQQKIMIVRGFDLSWVYRLSRIHDYEQEPSWPFPYDIRVTSSELSLLLSRDTRDDRFDPRHGSLLTGSLSYAPRYLGSDLNYVRSFTQFTMYRSVLPGVVWASCYRLGLASAFGEVLIPGKRFYAGGGTSIRGFRLDAVGPVDIWTGLPEGGEAMLVTNQELRFPIYKIFRGVIFLDAGNVYSRLSDFNPGRLRTGAGFGLRIDSPLGLVRIDYGFNLKPRWDEPKSTLFISIGQAF